MPDTLYTKVWMNANSAENWDTFGPAGTIFVNSGDIFQRDLTTSAVLAGPHSFCVNDTQNVGIFTRATTLASQDFRTNSIPLQNINQWANKYNYCTVYQTDIILEIGNLYTLDAGFSPYGNGEDGYYLYYALPNIAAPTSVYADAVNPWAIHRSLTRVTDVLKTPGIKRVKLRFPNTTGNETTVKLRIRFKLKDVYGSMENYMLRSVGSTDGAKFTAPIDRTGFNAAVNRHMFYFWMGTDAATSNWNMQARWKASMYFKVKLWQPRFGSVAPSAGLRIKTRDDLPVDELPTVEEQDEDAMDFEKLEPPGDDDDDDSVPSTPVIEQLTRELAQFGNAKKNVPKTSSKKA